MTHKFGDLFRRNGATVVVDGQYGSAGKGVLNGILAEKFGGQFNKVTTNAGTNSGHTAYLDDGTGFKTKVVSQQLPIAGLVPDGFSETPITIVNAGAMVDPLHLIKELDGYGAWHYGDVLVHPKAVWINEDCKQTDMFTVNSISGTGKGTGPALASKVNRLPMSTIDKWERYRHLVASVMGSYSDWNWENPWNWDEDKVVVEVSQGFSLGYHSMFHPFTTSRECTVQQAIADARIPYNKVNNVIMACRTFPIRVGSVGPGSSGGMYEDQREISWHSIGREPELTTVTKRERRLFTWSRQQFRDAFNTNQPNVVFINFMNYLHDNKVAPFLDTLREDISRIASGPVDIWLGWGPYSSDVEVLR